MISVGKDCHCGHSRLLPASLCVVCDESEPESLLDISLKFIIHNLNTTICEDTGLHNLYKLRPNIILPTEICDRLIQIGQSYNKINNKLLNIFEASNATRLTRIVLNNSDISDLTIGRLLQKHQLVELDLTNCPYLTRVALKLIYEHGVTLKSLAFREGTSILPISDFLFTSKLINVCQLKQLQKFTLHSVQHPTIFNDLISNLTTLTYLDLSECDLGEMQFLQKLPQLQTLILFNVPLRQTSFESIFQVKTIKHLDISQSQGFAPNG